VAVAVLVAQEHRVQVQVCLHLQEKELLRTQRGVLQLLLDKMYLELFITQVAATATLVFQIAVVTAVVEQVVTEFLPLLELQILAVVVEQVLLTGGAVVLAVQVLL
jgi:hypothetical protein